MASRLFPDAVVIKIGTKEIIAGRDGVSPVVTTEPIPHGNRVIFTDVEGQHSVDIMDGASAYEQAVAGGYEGTEEQFAADLIAFPILSEQAKDSAEAAAESERQAAGSAAAAYDNALAADYSAGQSESYMQRAANISAHMPVISENNTWETWDVLRNAYVDTGRPSKGDKGDKGDTGESGVVTQINAFFTMSVDAEGNLYVNYADGGAAPEFAYDSTSGNLYFVTEG